MVKPTRITVLRGQPDEDELAAVTVVLLALARRAEEPDQAAKAAYAGWTVKGGDYRHPMARPGS
ncbi:acyl-CoA carboxylase subunit epsilon [Streptomyces ficellus]|uniref:Acyl-CoA carboxylase subunit epsilon n=1 Tax=Streptomyces ficellus TaxID=1977088 RepID=A0ABT7Z7A5_9ACTN|nr:acyl-CoA carboxylase subunit epsilon [Streptomyces ficellus]MDN3295379.1 acyl-CoA carboxylase subunit epsilon [Streptomyces ficellus]